MYTGRSLALALGLGLAAPAALALTWSDRALLNPARALHAGGVIDTRIYVAGGGAYGSITWPAQLDAQVYNAATDTWGPLPSMSVRRNGAAGAVALWETSPGTFVPAFFVIGGWDTTPIPDDSPIPQLSIEVYDPVARAWTLFPQPLPNDSVVGMAAATVGNLIYVFGGFDGSNLSDQVLIIDPTARTVTAALFTMPAPASDGAAVAVGGLVYYLGGWQGSFGTFDWFNQTRSVDVASGIWSFGEAPPRPTANPGAAAQGDVIYLVGGWDGSSETYNQVSSYDTVANAWTDEALLNCDQDLGLPSLKGRAGLTAHMVTVAGATYLHAVGGAHGISEPVRCHEYTGVGTAPDTKAPDFAGLASAAEVSCLAEGRVEVHLDWLAASDDTGPVLYDVHRSTDPAFTPDALNRIAQDLPGLTHVDALASGDCGLSFTYVVRARDSASPPNQEANLERRTVDLACATPILPADIGNLLFATRPAGSPLLDWSSYPDAAGASHYHVYRSEERTMLPGARIAEPLALTHTDTDPVVSALALYEVRAAIDCGDAETGD